MGRTVIRLVVDVDLTSRSVEDVQTITVPGETVVAKGRSSLVLAPAPGDNRIGIVTSIGVERVVGPAASDRLDAVEVPKRRHPGIGRRAPNAVEYTTTDLPMS